MKNNQSNIQKWIILLLFSICTITIYSQREVDFKFDDFCVRNGDQIEVDVKVCGFSNIIGFQFSLQWNPMVLSYVEVKNFNPNLDGYDDDSFGKETDDISEGFLRTLWNDFNSPSGTSLLSNSVLYTAVFDVVSMKDTMTDVGVCRFSCPLAFEIIDSDQRSLNFNTLNGKITTKNTIVPVELSLFKGSTSSKAHHLHWQTASEFENLGFEIERSSNAKEWEVIDFLKGQGTSLVLKDYYYIDESPAEGINYYRLKQIDFGGTYEYSSMLALEYEAATDNRLLVYPNPIKDVLHYQIGIEHNDIQQIKLLNLNVEFVKT